MTERYFVEIHAPNASERHELTAPHVILGSANANGIRPENIQGLQPEHVRLSPSSPGCHVSLMAGVRGPMMYRGAPQWEILVPWGEEVFLENIRFTLLRESNTGKSSSPVLLGALTLAVAFAFFSFLHSPDDELTSGKDLDPPALVAALPACPEKDPARASALAVEKERAALAKEERSAFAIADGSEALSALGEAETCYGAAGAQDDATRLHEELARWSERMNEDYAATRLRLRSALEHQRWHEARAAAKRLEALLVNQGGTAYVGWVTEIARRLDGK